MGEDTDALDRTNNYRAKHGVGPLTLDQTLNNHAQAWADRAGTFRHDPDSPEGENIALGQAYATNAVDDFYNEVQKYDFNNPGFSGETGHFTQLVWKSTERMGIGIGNINGQRFYVFRYAPSGNVVGDNGRYFRENVFPAKNSAPQPPPTGPGEPRKYTIKAGDTFWSISQQLGVSVDEIQRLNPGVKPEQLSVGQIINVPGGNGDVPQGPPTGPPPPRGSGKYTIKAGDTFWSISQQLGVSVDEIQRLNPGVKPEQLSVGQIINVPGGKGDVPQGPPTGPPAAGRSRKYTIKAGDTFWAIAQQLGVSVDDIQRFNPGVKPEQLSVGQTINVPGGNGGN